MIFLKLISFLFPLVLNFAGFVLLILIVPYLHFVLYNFILHSFISSLSPCFFLLLLCYFFLTEKRPLGLGGEAVLAPSPPLPGASVLRAWESFLPRENSWMVESLKI